MRATVLLLTVATMGLASAAWAGPEIGAGNADVLGAPSRSSSDGGGVVRDMRKGSGQVLRCWQQGRLVYEGSGFRTAERNGATVSVSRGEGDGVTVLDLKDGMCMLSNS
jgi:hypothetical protein